MPKRRSGDLYLVGIGIGVGMDRGKNRPRYVFIEGLLRREICAGYSQPLPLLYEFTTPIAMMSRIFPPLILKSSDIGMLFG
jgi:hypothetical protein